MQLSAKLGPFAQSAPALSITDVNGDPVEVIMAGKTTVSGPWKLVTKSQVARVTGVVTLDMCNTANAAGTPVYEFEGYGWRPQAEVGDYLMQDVDNLDDNWSCAPHAFAWTGVIDNGKVTYTKPGKPLLAIEIPADTMVDSIEGPRPMPEGALLTLTDAAKGDFFIWTADVVLSYINDYVEGD